jgi:hypothetical protein
MLRVVAEVAVRPLDFSRPLIARVDDDDIAPVSSQPRRGSGVAVGQHPVQLIRPYAAGTPGRDPLAQRSRLGKFAQERVATAQSVPVGHIDGIPTPKVTPTAHLCFWRSCANWGSGAFLCPTRA